MKLNLIAIFLLISIYACSQKTMTFEDKEFPQFPMTDTATLHFCQNQPYYPYLSKEEQEFYYWVNFSRGNPMPFYYNVILPIAKLYPQLKGAYLNSLKTDFSNTGALPGLNLNLPLIKMANSHSIDITSHSAAPSHNSINGESFGQRFSKAIKSKCGGENISYGGNNPVLLLVLLYLDIDMPSLGHRKALLNPNFTETGIGSSFFSNGLIFLVQDFACPLNSFHVENPK